MILKLHLSLKNRRDQLHHHGIQLPTPFSNLIPIYKQMQGQWVSHNQFASQMVNFC